MERRKQRLDKDGGSDDQQTAKQDRRLEQQNVEPQGRTEGPAAPEPIDESAANLFVLPEGEYEPTHDEIARAAYDRFQQRGGEHGYDFDDWVEAEKALRRTRR
jgi:hypothetical protein